MSDPGLVLARIFDFLELEWSGDGLDEVVAEAELLVPEMSFHRTTADAKASRFFALRDQGEIAKLRADRTKRWNSILLLPAS